MCCRVMLSAATVSLEVWKVEAMYIPRGLEMFVVDMEDVMRKGARRTIEGKVASYARESLPIRAFRFGFMTNAGST
jgi:hypothetical protein